MVQTEVIYHLVESNENFGDILAKGMSSKSYHEKQKTNPNCRAFHIALAYNFHKCQDHESQGRHESQGETLPD